MAARLARFVECTNLMVPVYLIASPRGGGGGGFNGQRLTLEIGGAANAYPTLEHELFHALLRTQDNLIGKAAHSAPGLDAETLSEGLAYAFNPGLDSADPSDRLLSQAAAYHAQQASLKDAYPRFTLYGLALRPLLKSALSDKRTTLKTFLPRAADAWLVLTEIDKTRWVKDPSHDIYIFGLWDEEGIKSLKALLPVRRSVWGWRHLARFYAEMLNRHAKPGDDVLLLFSLDDPDARTPEEYADLLPKSWGNVESRLRQGQSVTLQGAARQMRVFLLAAPTQEKLRSEFRRLVAARALPLLASGEDHN
jgi:hypothetical protein